jgi:hypothetical protein
MSETEINLALTGANGAASEGQPALPERSAERAAHDPIEASATEDETGEGEDIPF